MRDGREKLIMNLFNSLYFAHKYNEEQTSANAITNLYNSLKTLYIILER